MNSNIRISSKEYEKVWNNLVRVLEQTSDRSTMSLILRGTLGSAERVMMAKRLM